MRINNEPEHRSAKVTSHINSATWPLKNTPFFFLLPYHLLLSPEHKELPESRGNEQDIKSPDHIQRPEQAKGEVHPSAKGSCPLSQSGKGRYITKGRPIYKWLGCVPIFIEFNSQQLFSFLWLKQTNKQQHNKPTTNMYAKKTRMGKNPPSNLQWPERWETIYSTEGSCDY